MPNAERMDPLPAFNFVVQFVDDAGEAVTVGGFSECGGLESSFEVHEYQEGGVNDRVHKFVTRAQFGAITLKHGVTFDGALRSWHDALLEGRRARRDGIILLLDERRAPALAWRFQGGLPVKWTGPTLNATASEAAIETLEIAVERIEPFDPGGL
jgi:phage tail-like protein